MATGKRRGRGEGSVEELPSGKFRAILSAGVNNDGKQRKLTFTANTKREALAWLRQQQAAQAEGRLVEPTKMLLGVWLDNWLKQKKGQIEPGSWKWYSTAAEQILKPKLGGASMGKMKRQHVQQMLADLTDQGVSVYQQRKAMTTLRTALNDAVEQGYLYANPTAKVKKPKAVRRTMTCWTREQARTFLAAAQTDRLAALYALAIDTGCRQGEQFGAHWSDFDFHRGTFYVQRSLEEIDGKFRMKSPKTVKGRRVIYLAPRTVEALKAHRERMRKEGRDVEAGPVFVNVDGGLLSKSNFFNRSWKKVLKRAGVPRIRPGDMRHTAATLLLEAGAGVKMVSERLGHEDIQTTLKFYAVVLPSQQEQAGAIVQHIFDNPTVIPPTPTTEQPSIKGKRPQVL